MTPPPTNARQPASLAATPMETAGALLAGIVGAAALAGLATGALGIWPRDGSARTPVSGEMRGACMALDMAEAHGALDERQRRVVMRALATSASTHATHFIGGLRGLQDACSDVARQRWAPARDTRPLTP